MLLGTVSLTLCFKTQDKQSCRTVDWTCPAAFVEEWRIATREGTVRVTSREPRVLSIGGVGCKSGEEELWDGESHELCVGLGATSQALI